MSRFENNINSVLQGYTNFVKQRKLVPEKNIPFLTRWVHEFLNFAHTHPGYSFEQTHDYFLKEIGGRTEIQPWQIRQASDAVRIYRFQFRKNSGSETEI